jgi:cell division protein FtsW (lipid II flippase)
MISEDLLCVGIALLFVATVTVALVAAVVGGILRLFAEPVAPKFNSKRGTNGHVTHYTRVYMDEYSLPSSDGYHKVQ